MRSIRGGPFGSWTLRSLNIMPGNTEPSNQGAIMSSPLTQRSPVLHSPTPVAQTRQLPRRRPLHRRSPTRLGPQLSSRQLAAHAGHSPSCSAGQQLLRLRQKAAAAHARVGSRPRAPSPTQTPPLGEQRRARQGVAQARARVRAQARAQLRLSTLRCERPASQVRTSQALVPHPAPPPPSSSGCFREGFSTRRIAPPVAEIALPAGSNIAPAPRHWSAVASITRCSQENLEIVR